MISFKWRHFQKDIILLVVRWYIAYSLSYRNIEEMMQERGISVDHSTIQRWVVHYAPKLEEAFRQKHNKRSVGLSPKYSGYMCNVLLTNPKPFNIIATNNWPWLILLWCDTFGSSLSISSARPISLQNPDTIPKWSRRLIAISLISIKSSNRSNLFVCVNTFYYKFYCGMTAR